MTGHNTTSHITWQVTIHDRSKYMTGHNTTGHNTWQVTIQQVTIHDRSQYNRSQYMTGHNTTGHNTTGHNTTCYTITTSYNLTKGRKKIFTWEFRAQYTFLTQPYDVTPSYCIEVDNYFNMAMCFITLSCIACLVHERCRWGGGGERRE